MRKFVLPIVLAFVLGGGIFGLINIARGQETNTPPPLNRAVQNGNVREITSDYQIEAPQEPAIGFIDSPSATCYQPDSGRDTCYLSWYYISVNASPNYMITMTVSLNNYGPVMHTQGFFQTSMYIPSNLFGDGIKVSCGSLGAGGDPLLGNRYFYTIRARDSAGLSSANYGAVSCPAYQP